MAGHVVGPPVRSVVLVAIELNGEAGVSRTFDDHINPVCARPDLGNDPIAKLREPREDLALESRFAKINEEFCRLITDKERLFKVAQEGETEVLV